MITDTNCEDIIDLLEEDNFNKQKIIQEYESMFIELGVLLDNAVDHEIIKKYLKEVMESL